MLGYDEATQDSLLLKQKALVSPLHLSFTPSLRSRLAKHVRPCIRPGWDWGRGGAGKEQGRGRAG
ncbi:hypothetical protein E2C01_080630 [Portunus trituberculatus]|uniref:Uncharacterized protein n=1 Tax=Portunus trituberculatus TaxID=210409 RepID=A0A5B7IPP8_PORTR|nr:hypothetical protein [Portunus trituberculatus]